MKNFLGNLSPRFSGVKLFQESTPQKIATHSMEVMLREVSLFEVEATQNKGIRFKTDENGKLIPRSGVTVTHGVTLDQFNQLYASFSQPLSYEQLLAFTDPIQGQIQALLDQGVDI